MRFKGKRFVKITFFDNVSSVAKSLKTLGLNKNDTIIVDLEGVPEFIYLFFAAEILGINVKNKIGADINETIDVINSSNAKYFFVHDYINNNVSLGVYMGDVSIIAGRLKNG